jgi:bacitracin synthase 3
LLLQGISKRLYKTGDLARWLPGGNLEFSGRIDRQVKIRGYRIELAEIEKQLQTHEHIGEAVVLDRVDSSGHRYLCGYITVGDETGFSQSRLRQYLSKRLPGYMIPSYFVTLDNIPLTSSGKIDRKGLPEPEVPVLLDSHTAPRNEVEEKLVQLWQEVLGIQTAGVNDNFFTLGGHSLKAMILISRISREWGVEFPLKKVFEDPTVRGFARFIREEAGSGLFYEIKPVEKKEYYPLSSIQKRLYFLHQIQQGVGTGYNVPGFFKIEGTLDKERFRAALSALVRRHEALRTCFRFIGNDTVQVIRDTVDFQVEEIFFPGEDREVEEWVERVIGDFIRPFDLGAAPLFRAALAILAESEYLLLFDIHHIAADGTSAAIIFNEFAALYGGEELSPLSIHYKDFAVWQNRLFGGEDFKRKEEYWLNRLSGELPRSDLPTDFPRADTMNFVGDVHIARLDQPAALRLRETVTRQGTTLFIYLLAVLDILLYRYYDQDDIIVGCGIAGRRHADLQQVIGMLANVLPIRTRIDGTQTFDRFLAEVKQNSIDAFENQEVQFERLVEQLDIPREPGRNPVFDVLFMVQNYEPPSVRIEGAVFSPYRQPGNIDSTAKYDISLFISETAAGIQLYIEYSTSLFRRETIEKFTRRFMEVLEQVMENQGVKLEDIEVLSQLTAIDTKIREDEEGDFDF